MAVGSDPSNGILQRKGCKATIAKEVVLAYPDFSKVFEIYTDASTTQLGAVITQDNRPIAFFSRKLSVMQAKYSVTEIELLAIVETLKEFKGMLWGQQIKVYTDHKNLTRDGLGLTSDRVYVTQDFKNPAPIFKNLVCQIFKNQHI